MKNREVDVVVSGAGMVGSAIACLLGKEGLRVVVLDHKPPSSFVADSAPSIRVSALTPATLELLKKAGALSYLESMRFVSFNQMEIWQEYKNSFWVDKLSKLGCRDRLLFDSSDINEKTLGYIVENSVVQNALHQSLKSMDNVVCLIPSSIESIDVGESSVSVSCFEWLENNRICHKIKTQLVVGADGINSKVRQLAGLRVYQEDYEQHVLVVTAEISEFKKNKTWQAFYPTGPRALLPLASVGDKNYASLVWYDYPEKIKSLAALSKGALKEALVKAFPKQLPSIMAICEVTCFPLRKQRVFQYVTSGIALAGDAAHIIHPLAGQGVNLGFQDANALCRVLSEAHRKGQPLHDSKVLKQYEILRKNQNLAMQKLMDGFCQLFSNRNKVLAIARGVGLALSANTPVGKKLAMRYGMGLLSDRLSTANYRL